MLDSSNIDEQERAVSIGSVDRETEPTGVLLISHGSRSPAWRGMLLDVHADASADLLAEPDVSQVRTAFMEYTEPSIATQLRAFDESGVKRVIVVPLLLTISDHSFDDIPTICGLASDPARVAELTAEGIEIYSARAELSFAPLLDFSDLVRTNLARRIRAIVGRRPENGTGQSRDGLVLVGYGSADFEDEWNRFFSEIRTFAETELGVAASAHSWCGHLVDYNRRPTMAAIDGMLERTDRVIVVPIFVAFDPMFQNSIIGKAVQRCSQPERVLYRADAILPEPEVGRWTVKIARSMLRSKANA